MIFSLLARLCWAATVALLPLHAWADSGQDCLPLYYMKSYKQALPSCQQAAAAGYDQAQYVLGVMYVEGLAGAKNNQQAAHWFKAAAAQGHAAARFKLNNIAQSDASIFEHYAQTAKQGDAKAQLMLGLMYHEGRGVKKNDVRAVYVLQQAASQGNGQAQLSLALILYAGHGVKKNEAQAKNWFTRAAQKGIADAQYSLGLIYATNQHFKSDAKAVRWWKKAAAQKHMLAQHNLAVMYLKGLGMKGESVEKNRSEAVYWLEAEAKHGNSMAQFNLAQLYSEGKWLHKNAELATNWFYRAGANYLALGQKGDAMKSANKIKQLSADANKNVPNSFLADVLTRQIQENEPRMNANRRE